MEDSPLFAAIQQSEIKKETREDEVDVKIHKNMSIEDHESVYAYWKDEYLRKWEEL